MCILCTYIYRHSHVYLFVMHSVKLYVLKPYLSKVQSQCPGTTGHKQDRTEQNCVGQGWACAEQKLC